MVYKNDPSYLWLKGRIFEEQPPKYFFANPKTDQAKLFLSQILDHLIGSPQTGAPCTDPPWPVLPRDFIN